MRIATNTFAAVVDCSALPAARLGTAATTNVAQHTYNLAAAPLSITKCARVKVLQVILLVLKLCSHRWRRRDCFLDSAATNRLILLPFKTVDVPTSGFRDVLGNVVQRQWVNAPFAHANPAAVQYVSKNHHPDSGPSAFGSLPSGFVIVDGDGGKPAPRTWLDVDGGERVAALLARPPTNLNLAHIGG